MQRRRQVPVTTTVLVAAMSAATGFASIARAVDKGGIISSNETWSGSINITGDVLVTNATLTVTAGSTITFGAGSRIRADSENAVLDFQGTQQSPIVIIGGSGKQIGGYGRVLMRFGRIQDCDVGVGSGATTTPALILEDSILVRSRASCFWRACSIQRNFIHEPEANLHIALYNAEPGSIVADNIVVGGEWVSGDLGGVVRGNVFISLFVPDGGGVEDNTHEHMFGVREGTLIERNIYIGASYGAIMGLGAYNGANATIRNNTFNLFGGSGVVLHLTNPLPSGIIVRNNLFMNAGTAINDEQSTPDAMAYVDYNLYAAVTRRYAKVVMTGRQVGDEGYDGHALPAAGVLSPSDVCVAPHFGYPFPYTDDEMLTGQVSFDSVLTAYRAAYGLKPGSPAIDAGDPQDAPSVTDGRCDIGAVEHSGSVIPDTEPPSAPGPIAVLDMSPSEITIGWGVATDNVGVVRYLVFRNGERIGSTTALDFTDNTVAAATTYTYAVAASDGVNTGPSSQVIITTPSAAERRPAPPRELHAR